MDDKGYRQLDRTVGACDYRRAVHRLRLAAAGVQQSEDHRRRIRAATRC
ncbi:MAG TPA: hypothetical protein VL179_04530 [Mycobacterium sp.]|nr:hypothetical protein [Mycobacterium sp.]